MKKRIMREKINYTFIFVVLLFLVHLDYCDAPTLLPPTGEVYQIEPQPIDPSITQADTPPQKLTWQALLVNSWAVMHAWPNTTANVRSNIKQK